MSSYLIINPESNNPMPDKAMEINIKNMGISNTLGVRENFVSTQRGIRAKSPI
jgi:hypothetical protein